MRSMGDDDHSDDDHDDRTSAQVLLDTLGEQGGSLAINGEDDGEWIVAIEFGREADDSPMAGGAAYGAGSTMAEALDSAAKELR